MADYVLTPERMIFDKRAHLSRWAEKHFAEKLTAEGFVSYNNEHLSWYKVINNEVLLSVYIFENVPVTPILPMIGYGITPLFVSVPIPQKITIRGYGFDDMQLTTIFFDPPRRLCSEDIWVQETDSAEAGAEKLDQIIFPKLRKIHCLEDAYQEHLSMGLKRIADHEAKYPNLPFNGAISTLDFIDELIYMRDWEMIKIFARDLDVRYGLIKKDDQRIMRQKNAIYGGKLDEHIGFLEARKKKFIRTLERKVGIKVE